MWNFDPEYAAKIKKERDERIRKACQSLMKDAYFTGFDHVIRRRRYKMISELSEEMLGYKADYEILT